MAAIIRASLCLSLLKTEQFKDISTGMVPRDFKWDQQYNGKTRLYKNSPGGHGNHYRPSGKIAQICHKNEHQNRAACSMPYFCSGFGFESSPKLSRKKTWPMENLFGFMPMAQAIFKPTKTLADKGIWVEYDCLARIPDYTRYVGLMKKTLDAGICDRLLLSQDAGTFYYGEQNTRSNDLSVCKNI